MKLVAAANNEIPAYEALLELGFEVSRSTTIADSEALIAKRDNSEFMANGLVELLGFVKLSEMKGENWRVTDESIDSFLKKFSRIHT